MSSKSHYFQLKIARWGNLCATANIAYIKSGKKLTKNSCLTKAQTKSIIYTVF